MPEVLSVSAALTEEASALLRRLNLETLCEAGESINIEGSLRYRLLVPEHRDIDLWLQVADLRHALASKVQLLMNKMAHDSRCNMLLVHSFFDDYPFDASKVMQANRRGVFLNMTVFASHYKRSWDVGLWLLTQPSTDPFPELMALSDADRTILLNLKRYVYASYESFYPRSAAIYRGFLAGARDPSAIIAFLKNLGIDLRPRERIT